MPQRARRSERRVYTSFTTWLFVRVGRDGVEPPQSLDRWVTASLARQCTPTLRVTQAGFEPAISTLRAWRPQPLVRWAICQ